jgi:hypothetical protein
MAYKEESVNETSQMGYDKYPHDGKLREREFTMVIHQKGKDSPDIIWNCHKRNFI